MAPQGLPPVLDREDSAWEARAAVPKEVRELIRTISLHDALWGAPRIYGERLKVGIDIGETSVSQYMVRRRKPPSQTWRTFLDSHVKSMVSVDFFAVPTGQRLSSVLTEGAVIYATGRG
jgi:hypothetical protein